MVTTPGTAATSAAFGFHSHSKLEYVVARAVTYIAATYTGATLKFKSTVVREQNDDVGI